MSSDHHRRSDDRRVETERVSRLLDDVATAMNRVHEAEEAERQAREELREKVRVAHDEGVPLAAIGRAAGLSRERTRQIYHGT
jgi:cell division septum initiation protein DivIVA